MEIMFLLVEIVEAQHAVPWARRAAPLQQIYALASTDFATALHLAA